MTRQPHADNDAAPIIFVERFSKAYQSVQAVNDLSFTVRGGDILGLVGPNGAGKTTTMRAIAGIIPPTSGRLAVAGHDIQRDPIAAKSALAYVPDDPHLFEALTVWEHLQFTAATYRIGEFERAAMSLLEQFELTPKKDTPTQELSRGMRQKTAISCAYLHEPAALMLDEPLTGLDPRGIRTMKQTLRERAAAGAAIIISSHLLQLVEDLCTHLLILHRGAALFFGTVAEARRAFAATGEHSTLEDVFFRITEGDAAAEPPSDDASQREPQN
jgi:ABC-2 type transport system ATP-binding protein